MWLSVLKPAGCERFTCNDAYKLKKSQKWWYMFTTETERLWQMIEMRDYSLIWQIFTTPLLIMAVIPTHPYDLLASIFITNVGFSITISQSWLTIGGRDNLRKFRSSGPQDCNGLIWSAFSSNLFSFNLDKRDDLNLWSLLANMFHSRAVSSNLTFF